SIENCSHTYSRAFWPSHSAAPPKTRNSALASAALSLGSTIAPNGSTTISSGPPQRVATTGTPQASDSAHTNPHVSFVLGAASTSCSFSSETTRGLSTSPTAATRSATPYCAAS